MDEGDGPVKLVLVPERGQVNPLSLPQQLAEINKTFTYHGVPIHPRAVQDLTSWLSDGEPGPVAINVEMSLNSNRYYGVYALSEKHDVFIDFKKQQVRSDGWFSYRHLGRLDNGLHVLQTSDNGGGKLAFEWRSGLSRIKLPVCSLGEGFRWRAPVA